MNKKTGIFLILFTLCLFLGACGKKGADKRGIRIYYLNKGDYGIQEQELKAAYIAKFKKNMTRW